MRILFILFSACLVQATLAETPNILLLYADDLGYGDLGCYNPNSKIPTPALDALAADGMLFTDGHSSSGICTPSRYALLTGRHHWRDFHGIVGALGASVFEADRLTLPEMLQKEGYKTACIGKWHLGWDWDALRQEGTDPKSYAHTDFDWSKPIPDGPLAHGFDYYFGDAVINFPPYCWIENDRVLSVPNVTFERDWQDEPPKEGRWETRPGPGMADWDFYDVMPTLAEKGVEYLKGQKDSEQPFFLYFPFPSPHAPIIPNDEFDGKSDAGPYGDFVYQTDHICGRLIQALKDTGKYENTIIIFSADNGAEKYAYERDQKFDHWSSKPLRGLKRDIYEGGHRVPFLIRWPGLTKPGSVSDALVSQIDLMATVASFLQIDLPKQNCAEDSHDLVPLLAGNTDKVREAHIHNTKVDNYAIRQGPWLLIDTVNGYESGRNKHWETRHNYPADNDAGFELFHLENDPGQRNDVAADHPGRVAAMQELLKKIREQGFSAPRLAN
ncbi:MAG: arylsulfatase [Verrucomicrobiota bacterium]